MFVKRDLDMEAVIRQKYLALQAVLDERARRLWAAAESRSVGYGGDAVVASATGLMRTTIRAGREELESGDAPMSRLRRPGGGRKSLTETQNGWVEALERLVAPTTRGDPMSPLQWTCKSTRNLASELRCQGQGSQGHRSSRMNSPPSVRDQSKINAYCDLSAPHRRSAETARIMASCSSRMPRTCQSSPRSRRIGLDFRVLRASTPNSVSQGGALGYTVTLRALGARASRSAIRA